MIGIKMNINIMKNLKLYLLLILFTILYFGTLKISFEIKYRKPQIWETTLVEGTEFRTTRDGYLKTTNKKDLKITETKNGFLSVDRDTTVVKDYYTWRAPY